MIMLRELRLRCGMTQSELAEKIGSSLKTIRNWELGATTMSATQVCECAEALGCTPNDICGWSDEMEEEQRNLNECYESMNEKGRTALAASACIISELSGAKG